jgi:hypothetical protein
MMLLPRAVRVYVATTPCNLRRYAESIVMPSQDPNAAASRHEVILYSSSVDTRPCLPCST